MRNASTARPKLGSAALSSCTIAPRAIASATGRDARAFSVSAARSASSRCRAGARACVAANASSAGPPTSSSYTCRNSSFTVYAAAVTSMWIVQARLCRRHRASHAATASSRPIGAGSIAAIHA